MYSFFCLLYMYIMLKKKKIKKVCIQLLLLCFLLSGSLQHFRRHTYSKRNEFKLWMSLLSKNSYFACTAYTSCMSWKHVECCPNNDTAAKKPPLNTTLLSFSFVWALRRQVVVLRYCIIVRCLSLVGNIRSIRVICGPSHWDRATNEQNHDPEKYVQRLN